MTILKYYSYVVIANVVISWLIAFNIINTSNRFIYGLMDILFRLSDPSLRIVRRYIPTFGNIDISPIIVFLFLWFLHIKTSPWISFSVCATSSTNTATFSSSFSWGFTHNPLPPPHTTPEHCVLSNGFDFVSSRTNVH